MSNATFPNGLTLTSTALTPKALEVIVQGITAQILGFDPVANPAGAFDSVRVGWQGEGQPAWERTQDVCCVLCAAMNDPVSQFRDDTLVQNPDGSLTDEMAFTQVWKVHFTLYGPNCYDHARLISSCMSFAWVHDLFAAQRLYAISRWERPQYVPENFAGQWWERADLEYFFNELALENMAAEAAESVPITLIKENGLEVTVTLTAPSSPLQN